MKKTVSLILTVLLIFSCISLISGAQEPPKLVVLGDSIALGSGLLNAKDAVYGKIIADTLGWDYINYGVNGYTSSNLLKLISEPDVANELASADVINISIGGNDFLQQNVPLLVARVAVGNYKNIDDITANLAENYAEIISTIKRINPDVTILAQTLYNPRVDLLSEIYGLAVERVDACIYEYDEQNPGEIEIVEVRPAFEGRFDYVAIDTIHPSASGNEAIARLHLQKLYELGLSDTTEPVILVKGIDSCPGWSVILGLFATMFISIGNFFGSIGK